MNFPEHTNIGEIILYQPDNSIHLEVIVKDETVWLTQVQMGMLFGRDRTVIGRHIRNIFIEDELQEDVVCAKFAHTTPHGAIKDKMQITDIQHYNLDVIISVGYRVKSKQGTQFRQWANRVLKKYLLQGYAINQRIERVERFAVETEQHVTEIKVRLDFLKQYMEEVFADYNDINEDTRTQFELINSVLAKLQSDHKLMNKPRNPIGFKIPENYRTTEQKTT